jgi:hypothetical protein
MLTRIVSDGAHHRGVISGLTEIQSELAGAFFRTRCSRSHEGVPGRNGHFAVQAGSCDPDLREVFPRCFPMEDESAASLIGLTWIGPDHQNLGLIALQDCRLHAVQQGWFRSSVLQP